MLVMPAGTAAKSTRSRYSQSTFRPRLAFLNSTRARKNAPDSVHSPALLVVPTYDKAPIGTRHSGTLESDCAPERRAAQSDSAPVCTRRISRPVPTLRSLTRAVGTGMAVGGKQYGRTSREAGRRGAGARARLCGEDSRQ